MWEGVIDGFFLLGPIKVILISLGTTFFPLAFSATFPFCIAFFVVVPSYSPLLIDELSTSESLGSILVYGAWLVFFFATCLDEDVFFGGMVPIDFLTLVTK